MAKQKLNEKQKMFCREYIIDFIGKQAAIRAGYSPRTAEVQASRLLSLVKISEYVQRLMDKRSQRVEIDADDVLRDILDTRTTCAERMLKTDSDGNEVIDGAAVNGRNKTNEMLGKHLKLFTDKVETETKGELTINFNMPRPKKES